MNIPLSEKLRPTSFNKVVGQDQLLQKEGWFLSTISSQKPFSFYFSDLQVVEKLR